MRYMTAASNFLIHGNIRLNTAVSQGYLRVLVIWARLKPVLIHGHIRPRAISVVTLWLGEWSHQGVITWKIEILPSQSSICITHYTDTFLSQKCHECSRHILEWEVFIQTLTDLLCLLKRCWRLCTAGPSPTVSAASQEGPCPIVSSDRPLLAPLTHLNKRNITNTLS